MGFTWGKYDTTRMHRWPDIHLRQSYEFSQHGEHVTCSPVCKSYTHACVLQSYTMMRKPFGSTYFLYKALGPSRYRCWQGAEKPRFASEGPPSLKAFRTLLAVRSRSLCNILRTESQYSNPKVHMSSILFRDTMVLLLGYSILYKEYNLTGFNHQETLLTCSCLMDR